MSWATQRARVTGHGFYFVVREPARFWRYYPYPELPDALRQRVARMCPLGDFDAGKLTAGGPWRVALVFIPHNAVPYGEPEAREMAARIVREVEGGP